MMRVVVMMIGSDQWLSPHLGTWPGAAVAPSFPGSRYTCWAAITSRCIGQTWCALGSARSITQRPAQKGSGGPRLQPLRPTSPPAAPLSPVSTRLCREEVKDNLRAETIKPLKMIRPRSLQISENMKRAGLYVPALSSQHGRLRIPSRYGSKRSMDYPNTKHLVRGRAAAPALACNMLIFRARNALPA